MEATKKEKMRDKSWTCGIREGHWRNTKKKCHTGRTEKKR